MTEEGNKTAQVNEARASTAGYGWQLQESKKSYLTSVSSMHLL